MNKKLLEEILNYQGEGRYLALATIVSARGSSPRNVGAQMLVYPDGSTSGTVGGGLSEAETIDEARELLKRGGAAKYRYDMTNEEAAQEGGICGGLVEIFIETIRVGEVR